MGEPTCAHSYLEGGLGCIVCDSEAFEAYRRRLVNKEDGWIAVDLDGTLAVDDGKPFQPGHIGPPIPLMLSRVKRWLAAGRDVRIFTARVSTDGSNKRNWEKQQATHAIEQWCEHHLGRKLPITNEKDYMMRELWDDRAVQVNRNTGYRADGLPE